MPHESEQEAFRDLERGAEFLRAVRELAAYQLPTALDVAFSHAHDRAWMSWKNESITPSQPVREWHRRVARHLEETRQATCAALYHCDNVGQIERSLDDLVARFRDTTPAQDEAGRFYSGVTSKFSFEYHAFVFATVRLTNHIAMAAGGLFGRRCPTLLSLERTLQNCARQTPGAERLLGSLHVHKPALGTLFSRPGISRSIRDRIAHDEFLFAGSLRVVQGMAWQLGNLMPDFQTTGLGEEGVYRLSELMERQMVPIQTFLHQFLELIIGILPPIGARQRVEE